MRLIGAKAYLSWLFGIVLLLTFIGCGTAFRGLKFNIGKYWAGIAVFLLFGVAFSINRGESFGLMKDYIPKTLFIYFYCTAFALTLKNCRTLINVSILCTTIVLGSAALFGGPDAGGRFCIPGSLFLGNSNDLALTLVSSLGFSLFLVWQKSGMLRIIGSAEFLASLYFLLKTASRGGFLALVVCLTVFLVFSGKRASLLALAVPALCLLPFVPGSTLSRLVAIATPGSIQDSASGDEAAMSQLERTQLLQKSIHYAITHPVFGTGAGTFRDMLWAEDLANGTHTPALGTHNAYSQVASEWGFPAFFLYLGVIFGSIRANYRIMKRTRGIPEMETIYTTAACLLGNLAAFAAGSLFDHVAYAWTVPLLSGISGALYLATRGGDLAWIKAEIAAGNA